jgi:predicted Zn-dependent protease
MLKKLTRPMICGLIVMAGTLTGCATNQATGRNQLDLLGAEQEIALGEEAAPEFLKEYGGEIPSSEIRAYVSELGKELASVSERPDLPWQFYVVDSSVINAFALPGGKVFMSRGLLEKMTNKAQLAGVLGHEIGHVTGKHINDRMSQAMVLQGVIAGIGVAGEVSDESWLGVLGVGTQAVGTGYLLKFGRDQESEADSLGLRYMVALGYNPMAQVQVMDILKAASGASGGKLEEFFSTHPMPDTRIRRLEKEIRSTYPGTDDPGLYRYDEADYETGVLAPLKKLPAAAHNG